eukprot:m.338358 g.338358  ORF g.338358 m.338358 type:complete len:346 (+) comp18392_c0_seq1:71-1108(+)
MTKEKDGKDEADKIDNKESEGSVAEGEKDDTKKQETKEKECPKTVYSLLDTTGDESTSTPAMTKGETLHVIKLTDSGWYHIRKLSGEEGYVWPEWVSSDAANSASAGMEYPVSKDGKCPVCGSKEVKYIVLTKEEDKEEDTPELLKKLLARDCAFKYPWKEGDPEPSSFQCMACTYGFNLDFSCVTLEIMFASALSQPPPPKSQFSTAMANPQAQGPGPAENTYNWTHPAYAYSGDTTSSNPNPNGQQTTGPYASQYQDYTAIGNFRTMNGRFSAVSNDEHWVKKGVPVAPEMRIIAHYMDPSKLTDDAFKPKKIKITKKRLEQFKEKKKQRKIRRKMELFGGDD